MKKTNNRKFILLLAILFISIGFSVLTTNLSLNATFTFTENTFSLIFSNIKVLNTSTVTNPNATITNNTTINYSGVFNKPGDFIEFSFYIVNNGTVDGQINQILTGLTTEQQQFISYNFKYALDNIDVNINDIIYAGQARNIIAHFEYREDIEDFINFSSLNVNLTMKFIQPQIVTSAVRNYEFLGDKQYFIVPKTGTYKLEVWGGQGGTPIGEQPGGYGGYSSGELSLNKNSILFVYVGQEGTTTPSRYSTSTAQVFNGGGKGHGHTSKIGTAGGGATHIALNEGILSSLSDKKNNIIIVAGGGGGSIYTIEGGNFSGKKGTGGHGGGYIGNTGTTTVSAYMVGAGGTQSLGGEGYSIATGLGNGSFGLGGTNDDNGAGGGGGYYGGGAGRYDSGAGGGSGYIGYANLSNKIMYCYNCQSSENETDETQIKTRPTNNVSATPTSNYAKIGNGHARITYLEY